MSGMAVAGMASVALKGAVREAWSAPGLSLASRVRVFVRFLVIIVREVAGTLKLATYGAYAYSLWWSLRPWRGGKGGNEKPTGFDTVVVARHVRYGPSPRNL